MSRFILLFLILTISVQSKAQYQNTQDGNLKGHVKSVKMIHQKVAMDGDSIWGENASDNDPFWFNGYVDTYYIFDSEGRTIEYHQYFTEDADDNKTLSRYDKSGLLKEQVFYSDKKKTGSMEFKHDSDGRITKVTRYDENGIETDCVHHIRKSFERLPVNKGHNNIWIYKYDSEGRCIEEKCLFPNGKINYRQIFFYDENGRQERMISFDHENIQNLSVSYQYDKKNRLNTIIRISPVKKSVTRYRYDMYDNVVYTRMREVDILSERGNEKKKDNCTESSFFYDYDDQDNWVQMIFSKDGQPEYIQKREIKYF